MSQEKIRFEAEPGLTECPYAPRKLAYTRKGTTVTSCAAMG